VELADRYAEAKVVDREYDPQIKLLNARMEYEKVMAEVRERDRKSEAEAEEKRAVAGERRAAAEGKRAETKVTKSRARAETAKARQEETRARLAEKVERLVKAGELGPEGAMEWLEEIIGKIEFQHGGRVEVKLPALPGQVKPENTENTKIVKASKPNPGKLPKK
jgi:polyhydroxyalkanoate synthesis regulator phasin